MFRNELLISRAYYIWSSSSNRRKRSLCKHSACFNGFNYIMTFITNASREKKYIQSRSQFSKKKWEKKKKCGLPIIWNCLLVWWDEWMVTNSYIDWYSLILCFASHSIFHSIENETKTASNTENGPKIILNFENAAFVSFTSSSYCFLLTTYRWHARLPAQSMQGMYKYWQMWSQQQRQQYLESDMLAMVDPNPMVLQRNQSMLRPMHRNHDTATPSIANNHSYHSIRMFRTPNIVRFWWRPKTMQSAWLSMWSIATITLMFPRIDCDTAHPSTHTRHTSMPQISSETPSICPRSVLV